MLSCAFFTEQRDVLFKTVSELVPNVMNFTMQRKLDILLHGINNNLNVRDCRNVPLTLCLQTVFKSPLPPPDFPQPSKLPCRCFYLLFIAKTESDSDNTVIHL